MMRFLSALIMGSALIGACGPTEQPALSPDAIVGGVNYVGVTVTDLDASTQYYSDVMAMEVVDTAPATFADELTNGAITGAQTRMLRSVNAQIRLFEFEGADQNTPAPPAALQGPGIAHICFQVAQSVNMYKRALERGARPIGDADLVQLISRNPVYYGYAKDRDGIVFEIEEIDKDKIPEDRRPLNDYRIRHVSLATADLDQLVSFYSALLDIESPRQVGGADGISGERFDKVSGLAGSSIRMAWFQIRNLELEIFQYVSHPPEPAASPRMLNDLGYNFIVFDTVDLDRAREKIVVAGGAIIDGPETLDGHLAIFARDPDGNILAFQVTKPTDVFSSQNFSGNGTEK